MSLIENKSVKQDAIIEHATLSTQDSKAEETTQIAVSKKGNIVWNIIMTIEKGYEHSKENTLLQIENSVIVNTMRGVEPTP